MSRPLSVTDAGSNPATGTMKAFILAGGLGTRLQTTLGDKIPKALALVAGYPFILYPILWCRRHEINRIRLCIGYRGEKIIHTLDNGIPWGVRLSYSCEFVPLGTAGALLQAARAENKTFLVMNGDTYFDLELPRLIEAHHSMGGLVTMALLHDTSDRLVGNAILAANNQIAAFFENPYSSPSQFMSGGIYVFEPDALKYIPPDLFVSLERDVFPVMANAGILRGFIGGGYFADIGTPESLKSFEDAVLRGDVYDRP